ncbi:AAA family ATPase [Lysinibacillus sp. NPDC056959]|uniref:AAA family ATPase n=1 Tax=Lysinibacillus sp. NPDC056959 TaxID=3345981 RepID=UPI0036303A33
MDKIKWLQQMVEQSPTDPQAYYWLGKELAENGRWLEAVQAYSTGISLCTDDTLRMEIIHELTKASVQIQQTNSMDYHSPVIEQESHDINGTIETEEAIAASAEELLEKEVNSEEAESGQLIDFTPRLKVLDGEAPKKTVKKGKEQITFADVAGLDDLKKTINLRIISPFYNKGLFAKFRKKVGGGVLLYGPPGCGKTFIAKATAGECKANFYPVHITDILASYTGESEQNLKSFFDKARFQRPSIMFFDEVDTLGYSRSHSSANSRSLINTFLTEMEGIDTSTDEVLVMAATNTPWDVDNALKRPGRFDRLIFVAPPDKKAREQIFKLKLVGRYAEEIDVAMLAAQTEFFSGADIENVIELATENVLAEILTTGNERPITTNDLLHVLEEAQPSTLEWLRTAKNYVKYANQSGLYNDVEKYLRAHAKRI